MAERHSDGRRHRRGFGSGKPGTRAHPIARNAIWLRFYGRDGAQRRGRALPSAFGPGTLRSEVNHHRPRMTPQLQVADSLLSGTAKAAERAVDYFLRTQHKPGYWMGELTADTTLESDYILLQLWLHPPVDGDWNPP